MVKSKRKLPALPSAQSRSKHGPGRAVKQVLASGMPVRALLGLDSDFKVHQLVFAFGKVDAGSFFEIELRNVCSLRSCNQPGTGVKGSTHIQQVSNLSAIAVRQHSA